MKISQINLLALAVIGLGTWMAGTAPATTIIYQDSFARGSVGSPLALNGTSPDVVNTGAATWVAGSLITTDGTQADNASNSNAFLPFTPAAGHIYTLSASLDIPNSADNNWEALGFSGTNLVSGPFFIANPSVAPWVIHPGNGADAAFVGPATSGEHDFTTAPGFQTESVVLNTVGAQWTVSFLANNVLEAGPFTYGANPPISYVGFGNTATAGFARDFTLTSQAVPEPSSVVLLGCAALGLFAVARRRRAG